MHSTTSELRGKMCREETLKQFLDVRKHSVGVAVHWILFGSSHRETTPERGGMLRHYTRCEKEPFNIVKTIANTYFLRDSKGAPHNALFMCALLLWPSQRML